MTMFLAPYTAIADIDGSPLDAGFLFFGEYGKDPETHPIEVFWDADFTVPAAQPIRTRNGYPVRNGSPTKIYLKATQHSIAIKNRKGAFVLVDFKNKGWLDSVVTIWSGRTQEDKNRENYSVMDFGALGENSTARLASKYATLLEAQQDFPTAQSLNDTFDIVGFEKSLNEVGYAYAPKGKYWFNRELMIDDNQSVYGDGKDITIILLTNDATRRQNVITNKQNIRSQSNTYNHNISISDLTVDGRNNIRFPELIGGSTINGITYDTGHVSGCGLGFASVKRLFISNVRSTGAVKHGIDICASVYIRDGATVYPSNPSSHVRIHGCEVDGFGDDGITTHFSNDIEIYGTYAHDSGSHYTWGNSNGIEIDDGSYDVKVIGGYIYNCTKGIQVKGHSNVPSATRVQILNVTAENCNRAFEARHSGFETTSQTNSPTAFDVSFVGCTAINPCSRFDTTLLPRALNLRAYSGVLIEDLKVVGYQAPTVDPQPDEDDEGVDDDIYNTSALIVVSHRTRNAVLRSINLYKVKGAVNLIRVYGNTENIRIDGVFAEQCEGRILTYTGGGDGFVTNINGISSEPTHADFAVIFTQSLATGAYSYSKIRATGDYGALIRTGTTTPYSHSNSFDYMNVPTVYWADGSQTNITTRRESGGSHLDLYIGAQSYKGNIAVSTANTFINARGGNNLALQAYAADESVAYRWNISSTSGSFYPDTSAVWSLGTSNRLVKDIYAQNGTIITSDERLKQQFTSISEAEKAAALAIKASVCKFKFRAAVEQKGANARWHIGVKAQEVIAIMQDHGLNPFDYGFVCYDEWDAKDAIYNEFGDIEEPEELAGSRYAIRYDELSMFILAAL